MPPFASGKICCETKAVNMQKCTYFDIKFHIFREPHLWAPNNVKELSMHGTTYLLTFI